MEVYRARVPEEWLRRDPSEYRSIEDTKLPLVEYFIRDSGEDKEKKPEEIRITVHNFPVDHIQNRIPPAAQVERWERQLQGAEPAKMEKKEKMQGGFAGLFFKGVGKFEGKETAVLGWAMQLDIDHFRSLTYIEASPVEQRYYKQMRADYTIKATGPEEMIEKHRDQIETFASTFELIQPIPAAR